MSRVQSEDALLEELMLKLEIKEREKQDFLDNLLWKEWQEEEEQELKNASSKIRIQKRKTQQSPRKKSQRKLF